MSEVLEKGGLVAAGAVLLKVIDLVWKSRRQDQRTAVGDYQKLFDDCQEEHRKTLERFDAMDAKHEEAQRASALERQECEQRYQHLEGRFEELKDEMFRRYLDSEPPTEK